MHESVLESIKTEAARLASAQRAAIEALQNLRSPKGTMLDLAAPVSDSGLSVYDLDTLTSSSVKFAEGINLEGSSAFVPGKWLITFRDAIKNTANSYENLSTNIASIDAQHGGLADLDPASFSATSKSKTAIDFKKILANIAVNLDDTFAGYFQLRPAISAPRLSEFSDLFSFFATRRNELDSISQDLTKLHAQSAAMKTETETALTSVKAWQDEINTIKKDVTKARTDIDAANVQAASKLKTIEQTETAATTLNTSVAKYQSEFDAFQTALDARNSDYKSKRTEFEKLKSNLDAESTRIQRISLQAEDMLKGATTAGLAASYSNKQNDIEKEIKKARFVYYASIGMLVFLTLPIFIYSFPKEYLTEIFKHLFGFDFALLARDTGQPQYQQIISFIGRAIFLVPGLMFVRFASSRHERLFRLREDYAYKYSIASSVDGFMKQAKTYADDIAAACYYELTYNPADRMDEKAEDARIMNPLFEKMMARLEAKLPKAPKEKPAV
jgi:hypothetical protein